MSAIFRLGRNRSRTATMSSVAPAGIDNAVRFVFELVS
jgi:hypothetical protein